MLSLFLGVVNCSSSRGYSLVIAIVLAAWQWRARCYYYYYVYLAIDVMIWCDGDRQGIQCPGAAATVEAPLVVRLILDHHLLGLKNSSLASGIMH